MPFPISQSSSTLVAALNEGLRAMARGGHVNGNDEVVVDERRSNIAGINATISLTSERMAAFTDEGGRYQRAAVMLDPAQASRVDTVVARAARTIQKAGARMIVMPAYDSMVPNTAEVPVFSEVPGRFVYADAANLAAQTIDPESDEATVALTELPVAEAPIDRSAWTQHAIQFEIPRSEQKDKGIEQISAEVMQSIVSGIARAADAELLAALNAAGLSSWSHGAAAAAGVAFNDLHAFVGTNGTGATADRGGLFVNGVAADYNRDVAGTVVGDFKSSAIAIQDPADLLIQRDQANKLTVTCWIDMQALLPMPGRFFEVV